MTQAIAALHKWSTRHDAAFWFAMCSAEGIMPETDPPHSRRSR